MALTKHQRILQQERLDFLEKQINEVAREKHLTEILLEHSQPQLIILDAEPKPAPFPLLSTQQPAPFLSEHVRKLIQDYPGMLFYCSVPYWQVGLTLDKSRLVFVPNALYHPYEQECLQAVGWSDHQEVEWEEEISSEDEDGEVYIPDWPNPVRRHGVWKARQVAHWTGETDTPDLDYSVWSNGTWG